MKRFVPLLLVATMCATAGAQNSAVLYWNLPTTPSQLAYGAGTLVMAGEPQGSAANPASLADVKWRSLATAGVQWWGGVFGGSVAATLPVGKRSGTAAVTAGYWGLGAITAYDERGNPLGSVSAQAVCGGVHYGRRLFGGLSAGAGAVFSNLVLPQRSDLGLAFTAGMHYRWRFLSASLLARDLGPKYPVNAAGRGKLPSALTAGVRSSFWGERIAAGLQLEARDGERPYPVAALEAAPVPLVTARLGYSGERDRPEMSPLGAGIAVRTTGRQDFAVEYGYRSYGRLGRVQALSLGIRF